jgi:hypothetical protein
MRAVFYELRQKYGLRHMSNQKIQYLGTPYWNPPHPGGSTSYFTLFYLNKLSHFTLLKKENIVLYTVKQEEVLKLT